MHSSGVKPGPMCAPPVRSAACGRAASITIWKTSFTARSSHLLRNAGHFSFGDYFKRNAIQYAWEFLTVELKFRRRNCGVTVYSRRTTKPPTFWLNEIGITTGALGAHRRQAGCGANINRIIFLVRWRYGRAGPCTELFYDHGPDVAAARPGSPEQDGDRYIEIWNLGSMQFNRDERRDAFLPKPSVDTGMGLERHQCGDAACAQHYEIDLFQDLIKAAAKPPAPKT